MFQKINKTIYNSRTESQLYIKYKMQMENSQNITERHTLLLMIEWVNELVSNCVFVWQKAYWHFNGNRLKYVRQSQHEKQWKEIQFFVCFVSYAHNNFF